MRLGVDGFKIKGIIYLTSSPTPQCRLGCLLICGKCRAAFRRVACCASALSSHRSTITRLPSGTSPSQLHAIFAPSALFPGISRRCTWRSVASVRAQRAAPCGHFASLVRSTSSARLPSASLRRIYPRLLKCRKMRSALAHAHRLAWSGIPHPTPIGAPSRRITHPVT